jgi:hypothetical protein
MIRLTDILYHYSLCKPVWLSNLKELVILNHPLSRFLWNLDFHEKITKHKILNNELQEMFIWAFTKIKVLYLRSSFEERVRKGEKEGKREWERERERKRQRQTDKQKKTETKTLHRKFTLQNAYLICPRKSNVCFKESHDR